MVIALIFSLILNLYLLIMLLRIKEDQDQKLKPDPKIEEARKRRAELLTSYMVEYISYGFSSEVAKNLAEKKLKKESEEASKDDPIVKEYLRETKF